jgi:hypothetical protein
MSQNESVTNERQLKKKADQSRRDKITNELVLKQLMSTKDGRRYVWLWLEFCQLTNVTPNLDPTYMAWEKGHRNVGMRLMYDVTTLTPQEYILMTEEARSIKLTQETPDVRSPDDPDDE